MKILIICEEIMVTLLLTLIIISLIILYAFFVIPAIICRFRGKDGCSGEFIQDRLSTIPKAKCT